MVYRDTMTQGVCFVSSDLLYRRLGQALGATPNSSVSETKLLFIIHLPKARVAHVTREY